PIDDCKVSGEPSGAGKRGSISGGYELPRFAMDGTGNGPRLKDLSRAQNFAQRVVTSGFAYNVLRYDYDPKVSHRARIGPAAYQAIGKAWKRGETDGKKIADAARYFEEWHSLKKPASPQTL